MKGFFLFVFGIFLTFCVIRFCYGLESNTMSYTLDAILKALPDVKEDFEIVMEMLESFRESIIKIGEAFSSGSILEGIGAFFQSIGAAFALIGSILIATGYLLVDIIEFFGTLFKLLFGESVSPIRQPS